MYYYAIECALQTTGRIFDIEGIAEKINWRKSFFFFRLINLIFLKLLIVQIIKDINLNIEGKLSINLCSDI